MIVEIKIGVNDHVANVIEHYQNYGFESREALIERALQLLEQNVENKQDHILIESAELYAAIYEHDEEAKEWVDASINDWPQ